MTPLAWLALAAALALVPLPSVGWRRALGLSRRGRLAPGAVTIARLPRSRPSASAIRLFGCAAGAGAGYAVGGLALGIAAAVAGATAAMLISSALARRHEARRRRGLLRAIRLVVAELAAGSRPDAALGAAAAVAPDHAAALAAAASAAVAGGDIADVLLASGLCDLEPLAHAWRAAALSGAPMADVLGRVAADLADHEQQQRAVAVALAGPRSSGALLAALPVVGIALGAAMGARPLAFLLGTPNGRLLCCAGVVLDALGVIWTQRLIRRAERA